MNISERAEVLAWRESAEDCPEWLYGTCDHIEGCMERNFCKKHALQVQAALDEHAAEQAAEVERLRNELNWHMAGFLESSDRWVAERDAKDAELERLRTDNAALREALEGVLQVIRAINAEAVRLDITYPANVIPIPIRCEYVLDEYTKALAGKGGDECLKHS